MLRRLVMSLLALVALFTVPVRSGSAANGFGSDRLARIQHIVVIYEENHSFDNLYGGWEGVNGLASADPPHTVQVGQSGTPYTCLKQNDVNLTSPPLSATCNDAARGFVSHFTNAPFTIDDFIPPSATTCPPPGAFAPNGVPNGSGLPGGCTRDLVHRFYQEQYQLDGGLQDRYVTGSDAIGLTMGVYDTRALPIYAYLHDEGHPHYAIADSFFQAAFGGSFLNHQWLIAAATPIYPNAPAALHSIVDANGFPNPTYPLYVPTETVKDAALTVTCPSPVAGLACGDYAVNTIQPTYQPHGGGAQLPPQAAPTIGDRLSEAGIDWAWYSGGWSNADGDVDALGWTNGGGPPCSDPNANPSAVWPNCPDKLFQFHHQSFNYFAAYAPGTTARVQHLRDEEEFVQLARSSTETCNLKPVSFVKPLGAHNEHPGYASESVGSTHLVELLNAIEDSRCRKDTMVIVTYDEFGGQWDHVPPPGQGVPGPHDAFGPGTRLPALVISPFLRGDFVVDHTPYDTTSILATIERRFALAPLSARDAAVRDMSSVYDAKSPFEEDEP